MDAVGLALVALDDAWAEMQPSPFLARDLGRPVDRLPEISEQAVQARSARAQAVLDKIASVDVGRLPHELALTLEVARNEMTHRARAGEWYWIVFDPLQVGFYAMYGPTAYGGGLLLSTLSGQFAAAELRDRGDVDRYLGLVEDLGRLLRQLDARSRGQAARGIHLPRVQLEQAVPLLKGLRAGALAGLVPDESRLPDRDARTLVEQRVAGSVLTAFDDAIAWLEHPDRVSAAGDDVGLMRLPGGRAVYDELVRLHTTLDITAEEVHQQGLDQVAEIHAEMRAILHDAGSSRTPHEHMACLASDPAWRAEGTGAITAVFQRCIDRLEPHLDGAFRLRPAAPYGVAPLPEALAASMTFGYYDPPSPTEPTGRYLFNAGNLSRQGLANVAPLNYHELVPGHHFHIALQRENPGLHPVRRYGFINAFNEGWAEYAAHLAGELGMYQLPDERLGKLANEAFLATRLVVDTGMNALGWSLEQAREYMRQNTFASEAEVLTDSVRYSCDLPGQALAYKIGDRFLQELRGEMQTSLGDAFDLRDFHDAVLSPGSLPLPAVAANVKRTLLAVLDERAQDTSRRTAGLGNARR